MRLNELVQVHSQQLGGNAEMASEVETLCEVDHAVLVVRVLERY
jgi:hypothetical protein